MQQRIRRVSSSVLIAATVGGIIWVSAGDLNPPSGAVTPTMKTLAEVEPRIAVNATNTPGDILSRFKITQPGSYYLTGNVTGALLGLTIEADDVTVDLSGYALIGVGGTLGSGILISGRSNVEIRNGTVRDFGAFGIFGSSTGRSNRVIDVRTVSNGGAGISLNGEGNLVKDCTVVSNGGRGIFITNGSTVLGNKAMNNGSIGISTGDDCTVTGNTANKNGSTGISTHIGCTVTGNTANSNREAGITLAGNNLVDQNTAFNNNQSRGGFANISACPTCTFGVNHAP